MEEELSREEVVSIFKESWKELIEEYSKSRALSTFCSEADVELHLAHKLLNKRARVSKTRKLPIEVRRECILAQVIALWRKLTPP